MATTRKKTARKKIQAVHLFTCHEVQLTIPREQAAQTRALSKRKIVLPDAYDEAIKTFEEKLKPIAGDDPLTPEVWFGKGTVTKQGGLKAAAAVLLAFGVSAYPVPPEQEAAARALAAGPEYGKNESEDVTAPAQA